jgi:2-polyprenyl-3-methyl-5-hydroxy-6-metoxy-1,4-benzoquinol methylase
MNIKHYLRHKRWQKDSFQPLFWVLWQVYNGYRFVRYPSYRSQIMYRHKYRNEYHQFSNFTKYNRYPDLFKMVQSHFEYQKNVKLLSFGCATGEEAQTLAQYLPQAHIIGTDINEWCLKEAKRKYPTQLFLHSLSNGFEQEQGFDAIFCLAVFQNPQNRHDPNRTTSAYTFSQFEKQLTELDKKLKPNGLLFIDHADFSFIETALMPRYQIANFLNNQIVRQRPIFNAKNQKIADTNMSFRIFRKIM